MAYCTSRSQKYHMSGLYTEREVVECSQSEMTGERICMKFERFSISSKQKETDGLVLNFLLFFLEYGNNF